MKKITNKLLFSGLAVIFVLMVIGVLALFSTFDKVKTRDREETKEEYADDYLDEQKFETRALDSFDVIEVEGVCDIEFVQSDRSEVEITATNRIINYIFAEVNEGKLKVSMFYDNSDGVGKVVVYSPECKAIKNVGVGSITCDSLSVETLRLDNEGVGKIVVNNMKVSKLRVENEGVGCITVSGVAETARIDNEGVGMVDVSHLECGDVDVSNDGLGKILTNK